MGSDIVQFREDDEALAYLRARGVNPNEFGREAFEATLRRLRAEERMAKLGKVGAKLPRPIQDLIREDRDRR